jgi:signal-transduction protein with cAMP-binding, CBS, and nucleotidyltransferase domain
LNHLQRDMLKDCFKLVERFKVLLSHHYKLQLIT